MGSATLSNAVLKMMTGISQVGFIMGRGKRAIADHFM